jgi:phospholipase D1/2
MQKHLDTKERSILKEGRNVWRLSTAEKAAFLVDAKPFFRWAEKAFASARKTIWILGWDFSGDVRLCPDRENCPMLGDYLRQLVETHEQLEVRILVWSMGPLYSQRRFDLYYREPDWANHPRISLRYDTNHPPRASHHQKIVLIDDSLAFVGGMDITGGRWDTSAHPLDTPLRKKPSGEPYTPVHDVQLAICGPVTMHLAELVRHRWERARGVWVPIAKERTDRWPRGLRPDLTDCRVGIARTEPHSLLRKGSEEAIRLTLDGIKAARRSIYIEAQYLTSFAVSRALEKSLRDPRGPEIVAIITKSSRGIFEHYAMGHSRNRLIRRLKAADLHRRLRIMHAVLPGYDRDQSRELLIHSKVIVFDDDLLRIGSSNLTQRSEGMDTECDIAIQAASDEERKVITRFRNTLLAEHLDCSLEELAAAEQETGSLIAAVERLNVRLRRLRPYATKPGDGATGPLPGTAILDARMPYWPVQRWRDQLRSAAARLFGWSL